jgi:SCY1-like protein 1
LRDVPKGTHQRDEYFALGIREVATGIAFLNNAGGLVHGAIGLSSIVVTENLEWKIAGFDLVSELNEIGRGVNGQASIVHGAYMVPDQYKPDEYRRGDWQSIPQGPPWAIDSWGLGCLIREVYGGGAMTSAEELRDIQHIPKVLLKEYQKLLGSQPARRYNPKKLIENSSLFENKLVETIAFIDNLSLKDAIEKEYFFRHLPRVMEGLATVTVERKILPKLCSALEFGAAPALAITPMLQAAKNLPIEVFEKKIIPTIVKLYDKTDRAIRVALLEHLQKYVHAMDEKMTDEIIYEKISTGFTDQDPFVRELTLRTVLLLAPKLTQRTLGSSLLKHLSKLQVDEEPAIRANTTICLGNVATYLSESTAKRVLCNAFTRALRDAFPNARQAGLMALKYTTQYYEPVEVSSRIVPSIAPLTTDIEQSVREEAFETMTVFVEILRRNSNAMKLGPEEAQRMLEAEQAEAHEKAKKKASKAGAMLSWAVDKMANAVGQVGNDSDSVNNGDNIDLNSEVFAAKSFGSSAPPPRLYGLTPNASPNPSPNPSPAQAVKSRGGGYVNNSSPIYEEEPPPSLKNFGSEEDLSHNNNNNNNNNNNFSNQEPQAPANISNPSDGWGDMDDDDEDYSGFDKEEEEARARLSKISTTSSRPASTTTRPGVSLGGGMGAKKMSNASATSDGWGSEDIDEAFSAPAPAAQRRPTNSSGGHVTLGAKKLGAKPLKLGAKKILSAKDIDLESMLG